MNKYLKIIVYGVLVWLIPFVVSFFIYPLKTSGNPLFESIMPLTLAIIVVLMANLYLKNVQMGFNREGVIIGISWFIINIAIDLILFLPASPMQMSLNNYMLDIGITYLMIPVITAGFGFLLNSKLEK
jgi:hypothetical protein